MTDIRFSTGLALALLASQGAAWADRPISGDMASVADFKTCQVESWHEHVGAERAFTLSPACGIAPGLELGLSYSSLTPRDVTRAEGSVGLKWVPASWKLDTSAGSLTYGLKAERGWTQSAGRRWSGADATVAGLLSWNLNDRWSAHFNAGMSRDSPSSQRAAVGYAGVIWAPVEPAWLFADLQGNNKKDVFGGTVSTLGARWWLVKDTLGLDFTASRESGGSNPKRYTIGLGWYGIGS